MNDSSVILIGGLIGIIIWSFILYSIIKSACRSTLRDQYLEIQIRLLSELLKQQGVTDERIREVVDMQNSYFSLPKDKK